MMKRYYDNEEYNESLNLFYETINKNKYCLNGHFYVFALMSAGGLLSPHQGSLIIYDLNKPKNSHILNHLYMFNLSLSQCMQNVTNLKKQ